MKPSKLILASAVCAAMLFAGCSKNGGDDQQKTSKGVLINGVYWALCNVDAPGTFTANPEDAGMFYQWNRKTGWSSTDPLTSSPAGSIWNSNPAQGDKWEVANDPCPAGWRVPTSEECATLCDDEKVTSKWETVSERNGRWFTDNESGNSVFLPASGNRYSNMEILFNAETYGGYWLATGSWFYSNSAHFFGFYLSMVYSPNTVINRATGYSVRCVAK